MFTLGKFHIQDVVDFSDQEWPAEILIPDSTPELLNDPYAPAETYNPETGGLRLRFGGFVFEADGKVILVDCGVGANKERSAHPDWNLRTDRAFLDSLREIGFEPHEIDIVVITHAHVDHVGWLTIPGENDEWIATFPNARHIFARPEIEYWLEAAEKDPTINFGSTFDSVAPLDVAGLIDPVDDGYEIATGVTLQIYPGHTPGNSAVWLESDGEVAVLCGDTVHHPIQLRYPDWASGFCLDGHQSGLRRRQFLDEVVEKNAYLIPGHFRIAPAKIERDGDVYRWA